MTNEPSAEFLARVRAAAADTPYAVTQTPNGFDVGLDLNHIRWHGDLGNRNQALIHRVRLDERTRRFSIRDDLYRLTWANGVPVFGASVESGRLRQKRWEFRFGSDGVQSQKVLDTEDGRRLITDAARELGWQGRRSGTERFALAMGVLGGAVGLVVCVALLFTFLG